MRDHHKGAADLPEIGSHFCLKGRFLEGGPYGTGHINDTYRVCYENNGTRIYYIHQRINHHVFRDPISLMKNIERVTAHQHQKLSEAGVADAERRALTLVPAVDGRSYYRDGAGNVWRTYLFIDRAQTYDVIRHPGQAFEAARAFGLFQRQLADLPPPRLFETIPDFHNTPKRFAALREAIEKDPCNRVRDASAEIEFAMSREHICTALIDEQRRGTIPERITHNDTKLNNVMLDDATGEGVCVIDLDTVMPGLALYDFGDMVRSSTCSTAEDERDLSKVQFLMPVFEALVQGYLSSVREMLTKTECRFLAFSGLLLTFECGIRFLTDHLLGDVYFKIRRPGQNLDRCRVQFKLVALMESYEKEMNRIVSAYI
ncbi:MAG: aminoglycoside phosphotransferase family protein [Kiritimatiellae bacterium]|nr:aminoglycoside phosphotransferase family protein [Kiritimatiellia bacterium]